MIAPPRMTFATKGTPADIRDAYLKSINASLSGCQPFKFTAGFSDAIAGRPIMIRYVDNRDLEKQSGARRGSVRARRSVIDEHRAAQ
jgi:hypothetical protein